ncbi:hypothetical protein X975_15125, partial [Stegodyphus mimosarum]
MSSSKLTLSCTTFTQVKINCFFHVVTKRKFGTLRSHVSTRSSVIV